MYKRIISFVLVIATVFCFAVPTAFAATEYYSEPVTWGEYILTGYYKNAKDVWDEDSPLPWVGTAIKSITTTLMYNKICEQSHDGYHASLGESISHEAFGKDEHGRYCLLSCDYCGEWFRCYSSDLIAAHDEYVASLDSTTANTAISISGYSATSLTSSSSYLGTALYKGICQNSIENTVSVIKSALSSGKFIAVGVRDDYLLGYEIRDDRIIRVTYPNPIGASHASLLGIYDNYDVDDIHSIAYMKQDPSTGNLVFTSSSAARAYFGDKWLTSQYYVVDISDLCGFSWNSSYSIENWQFSGYFFKGSSSSVESYSSSIVSFYISGQNDTVLNNSSYWPSFSYAVPSSITWGASHTVIQPTGTDNTSRTGSLMQTINNYNIDNSVVDNSSNVNYYISPKSYVTELPDDTIDIEQCTSPAMYDEETLVFTVPGLDYQILTTGWTYDYTTRTYDISVAPGTTTSDLEIDVTRIVITYGDDTVYLSLYLADGTLLGTEEFAYVMVSGDENFGTGGSSGEPEEPDKPEDPGEDPEEETHKHSYTSAVTTEPTCEAPGIRQYTCSECGDSYTEKIDATGHTWTVKQSVATEYDDTGAVAVQGYTIYKCSVCNTEYKDDAGIGPPNNSAGNTDGEGSVKKIGQLLGSILSGLLGMIEAVLGSLLDGLVRLADLVGDKLTQVVEIVTGLFDKIPQLFGGFTALLADVFVFIPEDIMTIFTFGAAAIVFVGILMFFIKR